MLVIFALLAQRLDASTSYSLTDLEIAGLLDLIGLSIAIWTLWSSIWLRLGGSLSRAFRLISLGALAFALSHTLDSILQGSQLVALETATVIHHGLVLASMLLFVPGLAGLADALPTLSPAYKRSLPPFRFWPLAVGLALTVGAVSFILYGFSLETEVAAFYGLDGSLILLSGVCVALVLRARLGGSIGGAVWVALFGLLLFSLAHPLQAWFYEQPGYTAGTLAVFHRLFVIPAFCLFALSITSLARTLNHSRAI